MGWTALLPEQAWTAWVLTAVLMGVPLLVAWRRRAMHGGPRASPVSILVVVSNREDEIESFMRPLLSGAGAGPWSLEYELVVVDAGSSDDTWAILTRLAYRRPGLRVLRWPAAAGTDPFQAGRLMCRHPVTITVDLTDGYDPRSAWATLARIIGGVPAAGDPGSGSGAGTAAVPFQADRDAAGP